MHPDLAPHLHTEECNKLIAKLKECHDTRKFAKFIGICNELDSDVNRCLKAERKTNQSANLQKSRERQEKLKELMKNNL